MSSHSNLLEQPHIKLENDNFQGEPKSKRKKNSISGPSESFPISCVSCRRKKIKCNKKKPCNQCIKRSIPCQFPSTFRNIQINEDDIEETLDGSFDHQGSGLTSSLNHDHEYDHTEPQHRQGISHQNNSIHPQAHDHTHAPLMGSTVDQSHNHPMALRSDSERAVDLSSHYLPNKHYQPKALISEDYLPSRSEVSYTLRQELDALKNENLQLIRDNHRLHTELFKYGSSSQDHPKKSEDPSLEEPPNKGIEISGETTEEGEKYYGPQSSSFMIESLKQQKSGSDDNLAKTDPPPLEAPSEEKTKKKEKSSGSQSQNDSIIANSSSSFDSKFTLDFEKSHNDENANNKSNNNLVERSLSKKQLPPLLYALHKFDDPDISSDSETYLDLQRSNFTVLVKLVELFFDNNKYYETFISRPRVFEFLNNYQHIKDREWENDDDLLLFYMILLLSLQKLTPSEFIELNIISPSAIQVLNKFKTYLSKNVLYHSFEKLRHNLLNESIITIQAYILCTEWYFIEQRYEECWSMMFHCCGIAYSIGLHVMGQFRTINSTSKNKLNTLGLKKESNNSGDEANPTDENIPDIEDKKEDDEEDDEEVDIFRYKVFFALKSLTGQICSILGRPNPISIQVNSIVLKSSPLADAQTALNLDKNKTQALLKIGLSECLRLSNSMLIENFMIDFTIDDLLNLNTKFEEEIELLEWFVSDEYLSDEEDISPDCLKIDKTNILMDLIVLHINKAKLFEPFVNKFEKIEQYDVIIKNLVNSILKFLELLNYFIENFLTIFVEKYFHFHTRLGGPELNEQMDENIISASKKQTGRGLEQLGNYQPTALNREGASVSSSNSSGMGSISVRGSKVGSLSANDENTRADAIGRSTSDNSERSGSVPGSGAFTGAPYNHVNSSIKFGKLFRIYFPFLNSSIYQGIIVVFTFLHYKFQELIKNKDKSDTILNNDFLKLLELNFNSLLNFDRRISGILNSVTKLWPSNISYLINKVLNHIKLIFQRQSQPEEGGIDRKRRKQDHTHEFESQDKFQHYQGGNFEQSLSMPMDGQNQAGQQLQEQQSQHDQQQQQQQQQDYMTNSLNDQNFEFTQLYGFHLNDPFWITNPENLPHFLSSPSDDGPRSHNPSTSNESSHKSTVNPEVSSSGSIPRGEHKSSHQTQPSKDESTSAANHIPNSQVSDMFNIGMNQSYNSNWDSGASQIPQQSAVPAQQPPLQSSMGQPVIIQQPQNSQNPQNYNQNPVISNTFIFEVPPYGNQTVQNYTQGPVISSPYQRPGGQPDPVPFMDSDAVNSSDALLKAQQHPEHRVRQDHHMYPQHQNLHQQQHQHQQGQQQQHHQQYQPQQPQQPQQPHSQQQSQKNQRRQQRPR